MFEKIGFLLLLSFGSVVLVEIFCGKKKKKRRRRRSRLGTDVDYSGADEKMAPYAFRSHFFFGSIGVKLLVTSEWYNEAKYLIM